MLVYQGAVPSPFPSRKFQKMVPSSNTADLVTLAGLLAPFDRQRFMDEHYGQKHLHLKGDPGRFEELFGWQSVDELLESTVLWDNRSVAMSLQGQSLGPKDFCYPAKDRLGDDVQRPHPAKVTDLLNQGATLILDFIDRLNSGARRVSETLEAAFVAPVTASAFVSWQRRAGYSAHFDSQEVFALQIAGHKTWRLYGGRFEAPADLPGYRSPDISPENKKELMGEVETSVEMAPGDLLYVPAGQFHEALTQDEASLHLSLGVMRQTGHDLLKTMMDFFPQMLEVRRTLPHVDAHAANQEALAAMGRRLGEALQKPSLLGQVGMFQRVQAFQNWGGIRVHDRRALRRFRVRWQWARLEGQRYAQAGQPPAELSPEAAQLAEWLWPRDVIDEMEIGQAPLAPESIAAAAEALIEAGFLEPL